MSVVPVADGADPFACGAEPRAVTELPDLPKLSPLTRFLEPKLSPRAVALMALSMRMPLLPEAGQKGLEG